MKTVRLALAAPMFALSLVVTSHAVAIAFTTDQSDTYWADPPGSEDGWGLQLVQRGSTVAAAIYVYAPSTAATFYVAALAPTATQFQWSGDLYASTGPWFGTDPFNPANVTRTKVGTMTWTAPFVKGGTLSYTVNGVMVTKNMIRFTFANQDYSGHFGGGLHSDVTGCANPAFNGTVENIGVLNVSQNGQAITLQAFPASGGSCSYPGTLTQYGQMGAVSGSYVCTDGESGTFQLFEMQVNITGVTGRFSATATTPPGCHSTGWFGGLRVTTF